MSPEPCIEMTSHTSKCKLLKRRLFDPEICEPMISATGSRVEMRHCHPFWCQSASYVVTSDRLLDVVFLVNDCSAIAKQMKLEAKRLNFACVNHLFDAKVLRLASAEVQHPHSDFPERPTWPKVLHWHISCLSSCSDMCFLLGNSGQEGDRVMSCECSLLSDGLH